MIIKSSLLILVILMSSSVLAFFPSTHDYVGNSSWNEIRATEIFIQPSNTSWVTSTANSSGFIKDWNLSGLIKDFNSSGLIKDWNTSGVILNYSSIISGSDNTSWNESYANTIIERKFVFETTSDDNPYTTSDFDNMKGQMMINDSGCYITATSPNSKVVYNCSMINGVATITAYYKSYYIGEDDDKIKEAWAKHLATDAAAHGEPNPDLGIYQRLQDINFCGNHICQSGEDFMNCPNDCKATITSFIFNPITLAFLIVSFAVLITLVIGYFSKEPEDDIINYEPRKPEPVKVVEQIKPENLAPTREEVEKYYDKVL